MKQRNPTWGCPRIAQQITLAFGMPMNKDVVRRILAVRYTPKPDADGPSWLTVIGHAKDSLWSVDLFRCESAILRAHWVLVVMDHYTRRIVGFGVGAGTEDGVGLCRMFNRAIRDETPPKYLSSDHDGLFEFHRWQANLRVLDVEAITTVPDAPRSHPFVERLIGTIRRECLDRTLFWTAADLDRKLLEFQNYYNGYRAPTGLNGRPPAPTASEHRTCASLRRIAGSRIVGVCITRRSRREASTGGCRSNVSPRRTPSSGGRKLSSLDYTEVAVRRASGTVTVPGWCNAAVVAWRRYACGSTPASLAVSQSV